VSDRRGAGEGYRAVSAVSRIRVKRERETGNGEREKLALAQDFRELRVWKEAMELVAEVYTATRDMPADERFGLTAQLRRAAVSVPSCIAEGNARQSTADYLRFLSMAAGSLAEVDTQLT